MTGARQRARAPARRDGVPVARCRWRAGLDPRACCRPSSPSSGVPALPAPRPRCPRRHPRRHGAARLARRAARRHPAGRLSPPPARLLGPARDRVIAISGAVARRARRRRHRAASASMVIHSGIDLDELADDSRLGIRDRLGLPRTPRSPSTSRRSSATRTRRRSLDGRGARRDRLPALHWVVAGEGPHRETARAPAGELGLERTRPPAGSHRRARPPASPTPIVFVMSSRRGGLGTSVLDAMALGIPVASTPPAGFPRCCRTVRAARCRRATPTELADAVARLLDRPGLALDAAERASARGRALHRAAHGRGGSTVYRSCVSFP